MTDKGCVLAVDDSPDILRLLVLVLARHGFSVQTAVDGASALLALEDLTPVAVVTDFLMPHMNGAELCMRMRRDRQLDVPIILFSSADRTAEIREAEALGNVHYRSKGLPIQQIAGLVEELVRGTKTDESVSATTVIDAPAAVIFAILADPAKHAAIDGTGRVRESLGSQRLTAPGQTFRMAMYHENHPDGDYQMVNRVQEFDPPSVISWEPGQDTGDGNLRFGGWVWRYDLTPVGPSRTRVTLSYDWSAVSDSVREAWDAAGAHFPPFPQGHLGDSLAHLAQLATS